MKFIIILIVFLLSTSSQIAAEDTTLVRIRIIDVDNITLTINDSLYTHDNYDNEFSANRWFIISLNNGEYRFIFKHDDDIIDTIIIINNQKSIALEFSFLPEQELDSLSIKKENNLFITSIPDSGFVTINGNPLDLYTPSYLAVPNDTVSIEVYKDGYEPLVTDLMILELQKVQVQFILMPMAPITLNADSLGYTLEKLIPPVDIRVAEKVQNKYIGMAETFLIFPFAQGLIAKLALDDDNQTVANIMVGTGAVFSAGSFLLSKILTKRKRNEIKEKNIEIEKQNIDIKSTNNQIELIVRKANAEQKIKWQNDNADKGVVKITDNEQ